MQRGASLGVTISKLVGQVSVTLDLPLGNPLPNERL